MAEQICDGIWLLGRYSPYEVGVWILEHNGEAAIMEAPPYTIGQPFPWTEAKAFCKERDLEVKYHIFTHTHIDHMNGYPYFKRTFPKADSIVHISFLEWYRAAYFNEVFPEREKELSLGGEPLFLVHAPKHSPEDLLIFFRGAVCTGDWALGSVSDCNPLVSPKIKVKTMGRVKRFLEKANYHVHTAFSAHGNEFRHDIDFVGLLTEMEEYWGKVPLSEWNKESRKWYRDILDAEGIE